MLEELVNNTSVSAYAYRQFKQLAAAYNTEYPISCFPMSSESRAVIEVTTDSGIGRFFYTPSDELYFHSSRVVAIDANTPNEYFKTSKLHIWIQQFMRCFKYMHVMSCVTKRTTYSRRTICIVEELYRVYWVKHDKS